MKFRFTALTALAALAILFAIPAHAQTTTVYFGFAGSSGPNCLAVTSLDSVAYPSGTGEWCPNQGTAFWPPYNPPNQASLYLHNVPSFQFGITIEQIQWETCTGVYPTRTCTTTKGAEVPLTYVTPATVFDPHYLPLPVGAVLTFQTTDTFYDAVNHWTGSVRTVYQNLGYYYPAGGGRGYFPHKTLKTVTIDGTGTITR